MRPAVFVPESKGLNDLLREFRGNRNHLAIVIDEFGRVAGWSPSRTCSNRSWARSRTNSTLPEDEGDIFGLADRTYRVSGDTPIERVSEAFGVPIVGSDRRRGL
jgi:magnesium and cobalt transporter